MCRYLHQLQPKRRLFYQLYGRTFLHKLCDQLPAQWRLYCHVLRSILMRRRWDWCHSLEGITQCPLQKFSKSMSQHCHLWIRLTLKYWQNDCVLRGSDQFLHQVSISFLSSISLCIGWCHCLWCYHVNSMDATCPLNTDCSVSCDGTASCKYATMTGPNDGDLVVVCFVHIRFIHILETYSDLLVIVLRTEL